MNPLPVPDPTTAVIYARVSSTDQRDHGYGLAAQRQDCLAFAEREGLEVAACFEEDARSTTPLDEREAGADALEAMLRLGAGVLLVARRDRLAREVYVATHAKRAVSLAGGRILYAEGGNGQEDSDLLLDDIGHAIAAHERRAIIARLRRGRETKAALRPGSYIGGRPAFGYRADPSTRELVIDEDQAAVVRLIFDMARRKHGVRAIATWLNDEGLGGRRWHPTSVQRVLTYEGYKRAKPGRIVDPKVYNAAQRAMASRRRTQTTS